MRAQMRSIPSTFALAAAFIACQDASTGVPGRSRVHRPALATAVDSSSSRSGNQSHFNAHNEFAQAFWRSTGGVTFASLDVTRGGPPGDPQTFLFYFIEECDTAFHCRFSSGSGLIPNQDFSVSGSNSAQLNTNTDGNPNFTTNGVTPPGLISLSWQENGLSEEFSEGTLEQRTPARTLHQTGTFHSASADASGSVLGFSLSAPFTAGFGSSSHRTIDIFYN